MFGPRHLVRRFISRPPRRATHSLTPGTLNSVNADDLSHFSKILPSTSILSTLPPFSLQSSEISSFNNDWMNKYHGKSTTVLRPRTTEEVSGIVKWCNERRIGIVPQGGNTGLVGGGVPVQDELILSLGNMNKVRSFDPVSGEHIHATSSSHRPLTRFVALEVFLSRTLGVYWSPCRNTYTHTITLSH